MRGLPSPAQDARPGGIRPVARVALLAIPAAVLCVLLSIHIGAPWTYLHDDNGAWFSATARTHILQGLSETKGQDFFLVRGTREMRPYLHHPPFISLYLAAVFKGTGLDTPRTARTATALLHGVSFLVFLRLAGMLLGGDPLRRIWSASVFAVVPMSAYFGKMPNHEVPGLLFLQLGVLASLSLAEYGKRDPKHLAVLFLSWFLVPLASWHATLSGGIFVLGYGCVAPRRIRNAFRVTALAALLGSLLLVIAQLAWAGQWRFLPSQHASFTHWLTEPDGENGMVFRLRGIAEAVRNGRRFYADIPWMLSVAWGLWTGIRMIKGPRPPSRDWTVLLLGAGSILYGLVFARAVRIHAYQLFYLIPFVALSSALALSGLYDRLRRRRTSWAVLMIVLLSLGSVYCAGRRFHRLYREPAPYATEAARAIEAQFY